MELINELAAFCAVLGFLGGVVAYVLRPLNADIVELNVTVKELRAELREAEKRWQKLEIKVAEIDQRARALHHRVDEITGVKTYKRDETSGEDDENELSDQGPQ